MTQTSPQRNSGSTVKGLIFFAMSSIIFADVMEKTMVNSKNSLWQLISAIESKMPISIDETQKSLNVSLKEVERNENFSHFSATGGELNDGLSIVRVSLVTAPSLNFDEKSALAIELAGKCITIHDVRQKFPELTITQAPRGGSLQETTVWRSLRDWGSVSFAFKEENPTCLFRVTFRISKQ